MQQQRAALGSLGSYSALARMQNNKSLRNISLKVYKTNERACLYL